MLGLLESALEPLEFRVEGGRKGDSGIGTVGGGTRVGGCFYLIYYGKNTKDLKNSHFSREGTQALFGDVWGEETE